MLGSRCQTQLPPFGHWLHRTLVQSVCRLAQTCSTDISQRSPQDYEVANQCCLSLYLRNRIFRRSSYCCDLVQLLFLGFGGLSLVFIIILQNCMIFTGISAFLPRFWRRSKLSVILKAKDLLVQQANISETKLLKINHSIRKR